MHQRCEDNFDLMLVLLAVRSSSRETLDSLDPMKIVQRSYSFQVLIGVSALFRIAVGCMSIIGTVLQGPLTYLTLFL